ncbi:Nn.00g009600.m01.CDS01 [Neocucurbitaria sp. VM-36]
MDIPTERPADADETQTASEIAVLAAASVLVFVTTVLRYLGRWVLQKRLEAGKGRSGDRIWGLDDLFNVLAVLSFYGLVAAVAVAVERGMGTHITRILYEDGVQGVIDYSQYANTGKAIYVSAVFYNTVLGMVKLSVLCLYLRIIRGVQSQSIRTLVWAVFGIVASNTLANVIVAVFQCWPIKAAWDVTIPADQKRCININAFYLGNAITGVTTDAIVYLLSIPIIKPLQMDRKTKLQLLATMLVGGFAVVTSAVRLGFIPALLKDPDASMAMGIPMNWSIVEPAVGILVSSGPAIRAIRYLFRKPGDDSYGSGAPQSTLRSRNGHIQLYDIKGDAKDAESQKTRERDNDSEEQLVVGHAGLINNGQISRTTKLEISYSTK